MQPIAIYGSGGLAGVVRDILLQGNTNVPAALLDSDPRRHGRTIDGLRVVGDMTALPRLLRRGIEAIIIAIGDNRTRMELASQARTAGFQLASAVHPLASISPSATIAEHVIIGPRVNVCVHAHIGPHSVLSAGTIVEHDNRIGAGVFVHPAVRLAGQVTVESCATLGIGACVIPGRRIGAGAIVAPGAVVIRDVPQGTAVAGAPARPATGSDTLEHAGAALASV